MTTISVRLVQMGPSTSQGDVRGHTVLVDRPAAKGGADRGAMGGELLLVALGGCFASTLFAAIRAREADIDEVRIHVDGTLEGTPPHYTAIHMRVSGRYADRELMEKLVTVSERSCLVANTLKGAVDLTIEVTETTQGQPASAD